MNAIRMLVMVAALSTTGCAMMAIADPIDDVVDDLERSGVVRAVAEGCSPDSEFDPPPNTSPTDPAQYITRCLCLNWDALPAGFNENHWHVFSNGQLLAQTIERAYEYCAAEMDTTYGIRVRAISGDQSTVDVEIGQMFYMQWVDGSTDPPQCLEWSDPTLCFDGPLIVDCPA